jgi:hypothetical protein
MITAIVTFAIAYVVVMAHFANIEAILSGSGRKR